MNYKDYIKDEYCDIYVRERDNLADRIIEAKYNLLFLTMAHKRSEIFNSTHYVTERFEIGVILRRIYITVAWELALQIKFASLKEVYSFLFDIVTRKDILPDQMEKCTQSLCEQRLDVQHYFDNEVGVFYEIYKAYLDDISVEEAAQLKVPQLINVFRKSKTESNALVKQLADEFRKNQTKTKLFNLWKEKTNSKTPRDWSYMHRTPILLMPLDFDLVFSPSNVSMFENDGLKSLLIKMEDGESGEIGYNSDLEFPEATCRIRAIKDSYSAICKKNPGFGIPKEFGNDERWDYLLEQVTKHGTLESVFDVNDFKEDLETKFHERISGIGL